MTLMTEEQAMDYALHIARLEAGLDSPTLSSSDRRYAVRLARRMREQMGCAGWRINDRGEVVRSSVGGHAFGVRP